MSLLLDDVRKARRLPSPAMRKQIRVEAGVSQTRLAAELGVDRVSLARWESGDRTPRGDLLNRYTDLLVGLQVEVAS
jgi:transcriptional regulator with XRE-family HTH domain